MAISGVSAEPSQINAASNAMGHFQVYEEKSAMGRDRPRSRIPRPVLQPHGHRCAGLLFNQEESSLSEPSSTTCRRTISFSSDDTGCPSSQVTSASGTDNSPVGSPQLGQRKGKGKRVRVVVAAQRRERGQRCTGAEAEFTSTSSVANTKSRYSASPGSSGKKASSPRSWSGYVRSSVGSKPAPRESEPSVSFRTAHSPYPGHSSSSSSHSSPSPIPRRHYHSCGDNHGIHPPKPEQYLTPLQQKELAIRHLKTKLRESESRALDREAEIEELKVQMCRMREDWIEEECHRVEAQLALKQARREIRQLRQVVESMRGSLAEKDKGIHKYFVDINIQNRKLEALLRSVELAQGGPVHEEPALEFLCEEPEFIPSQDTTMTESSLSTFEDLLAPPTTTEEGTQTDTTPTAADLQFLLLQLLKMNASSAYIPQLPAPDRTESPVHTVPISDLPQHRWSGSLLLDAAALVAPALPTVAWLCSTHGTSGTPPCSMGALMRACCVVGLRSLRRLSPGSAV